MALIPHSDGRWSWNDGPLFGTKEEALASARVPQHDEAPQVYTVDMWEEMEVDDDT